MKNVLVILTLFITHHCFSQDAAKTMFPPDKAPIWKSCASLRETEKQNCTSQEIFKWIYPKLVMPTGIKFEDLSGTKIHLQFTVSEIGKVKDVKIVKGIHFKVDSLVISIIQTMPDFIPANIDGKNVDYSFDLPLRIEVK